MAKLRVFPKTDLTGLSYGKLTVTEFAGYQEDSKLRRFDMWLVDCSCGTKGHKVRGTLLRCKGQISCGCLQREFASKRLKLVNQKSPGTAAFNDLLNNYKQRSRKKRMKFELTDIDFSNLVYSNCHYCGVKPYRQHPASSQKYNGVIHVNGIDRIDSNEGYTVNNSVSCCEICNKAKRHLSYTDFVQYLNQLVKHRSNNESN